MTDDTSLPTEENVLSRLYNETIDSHRAYLKRLHDSFNAHCEKIGADAKEKLSTVGETDEAKRKEILIEEQKLLDQTLSGLKYAINKSSADARQKLEEIQNKLEESKIDLDAELENL